MRVYEELFIMRPETTEEDSDAYVNQVKELITAGKGTVEKVDKWGLRKLAYRVAKCSEGNYILIVFSAPSELVREVERRMRVTDSVIKFLTVRIDEKMKKIEKRKKARDKRAARKPPPPAAPSIPGILGIPAAPAAAMPGAPAPGVPETHKPEAPKAETPVAKAE